MMMKNTAGNDQTVGLAMVNDRMIYEYEYLFSIDLVSASNSVLCPCHLGDQLSMSHGYTSS